MALKISVFCFFAVCLSLIDLRERRLPHVLTLSAALSGGMLWVLFPFPETRLSRLEWVFEGYLSGFLSLGILAWIFPKGMGMGDAFCLGAIGTFVGAREIPAVLFVSSVLALFVIWMMSLRNKKGRFSRMVGIPFGPFLGIGGLVVLLYPDWLVKIFW